MSQTFHLVDDDAKTHLWVAQGWPKDGGELAFYSGDAAVMTALRQMLLDGIGHSFRFLESAEVPERYRDLADGDEEEGVRQLRTSPARGS